MKCSTLGRGRILMHKPIRAAWLAAAFTRRMRKLYNNNGQQNSIEANEKMALTAPSQSHWHTHTNTHSHTQAYTHTYKWETRTRIATHIVHYFHTFVWPFQGTTRGWGAVKRRLVSIILGQPTAISFFSASWLLLFRFVLFVDGIISLAIKFATQNVHDYANGYASILKIEHNNLPHRTQTNRTGVLSCPNLKPNS